MSDFYTEISRKDSNETLVKMMGEFQGEKVPAFEKEILELLSGVEQKLIFQMTDVPYLDSSGLGCIIKCSKEAQSKGKDVIILAPSESVSKVLKLTHLDKVLTIIEG